MKQRGRKSAAEKSVTVIDCDDHRPKAPAGLDEAACDLWDRLLRRYPREHFNDADLQLLREFCHTSGTLLPRINADLEKDPSASMVRLRALFVKELMALSTKLRLCVSARTRGDLASLRDAGKSARKPWERPDEVVN